MMVTRFLYRRLAASFLLLLSCTSITGPLAAAEQLGELWQVSTTMSVAGMPAGMMPPQSLQVCRVQDWLDLPYETDAQQGCTASDFERDGDKRTWNVSCEGPPAMSGHGEITRTGADAYTGSIAFDTERGQTTIALAGQRLGGCDNPS